MTFIHFFGFSEFTKFISFNTSSSWRKKNDPQSRDDPAWRSQYALPTGHIFPRRWAPHHHHHHHRSPPPHLSLKFILQPVFYPLSHFLACRQRFTRRWQIMILSFSFGRSNQAPSDRSDLDECANNLNNDNLQGTQFLSVVAFTPITAFFLISTFLPIFHNPQVLLKGEKNLTSTLYRMFWQILIIQRHT